MPYLTPDVSPGSTLCRAIFIPATDDWIAIVTGALQELTFAYNWEQFGAQTPQNCADRAFEMLSEFIDNEIGCRVIGEIIPFAGASSPQPSLWLMCNGQSLLRADYPDLFAVIGTAYGSADITHFNIPDLRGRTLIHQGSGYTLANPVGSATHTLTEAEMPAHVHAYDPVIIGDLDVEGAGVPQPNAAQIVPVITENTYSTGGSGAHNNMQPSMPISYLIVAKER